MDIDKIANRVAIRSLQGSAAAAIEIAMLTPYKIGMMSSKEVRPSEVQKHIRAVAQAAKDMETGGAGKLPELASALWNLAWSTGASKK